MEQERNGGWIPVVSQWKGDRGQGKEAIHGLFTVFVDNIPSRMDAKSLFKLFTKCGIVKDVFIPFKRMIVTNSSFGFVRFDCHIAADVAIQKANGLLVDDNVLEVKTVTFDRRSREEQNRRKPQFIRKPQSIRRSFEASKFRGHVLSGDHRSFADVLQGVTSMEAGKVSTTTKVTEEGNG
ncbi:hypothetical protein ACSBR2_039437 [Camellia fascicularis]